MTQTQSRLYARTDAATARKVYQYLEREFEEEGFPVACFEVSQQSMLWEVAVYVNTAETAPVKKRINTALQKPGYTLVFASKEIPEIDWVAETLRNLTPVRAGRFVVHGSHDRNAPLPHEFAILIDAGLAFGSGHHGTTAGCLDMLDAIFKRRDYMNILDIGTGSGVLAIAAAKATRAKILASDSDPVATRTARSNSKRNSVAARINCFTADGFRHRNITAAAPFDLIIANILARPLQTMATEFARNLRTGGTAILSGLLPHQKAPLVARYRLQGLVLSRAHVRDGWLTLVMTRP